MVEEEEEEEEVEEEVEVQVEQVEQVEQVVEVVVAEAAEVDQGLRFAAWVLVRSVISSPIRNLGFSRKGKRPTCCHLPAGSP